MAEYHNPHVVLRVILHNNSRNNGSWKRNMIMASVIQGCGNSTITPTVMKKFNMTFLLLTFNL